MRATLCAIVFASASLVLCEQAETQSAGNLNALRGLAPLSVLTASDLGTTALASNLSITAAIQDGTQSQPILLPLAEQQQLALRDAFITDGNAYELADGLGSTLGGIYLSLTSYQSTDDGKTFHSTNISPAVAQLIAYANATARSDSSSAKYFFGNGTTDKETPVSATAMKILTQINGITDVFGRAYGHPAGSEGADAYGQLSAIPNGAASRVNRGQGFLWRSFQQHRLLTRPSAQAQQQYQHQSFNCPHAALARGLAQQPIARKTEQTSPAARSHVAVGVTRRARRRRAQDFRGTTFL